MSVILECKSGDAIYCIQDFSASPDGEPFSWKTCVEFKVGQALQFRSYRKDSILGDRPNGWMVMFQTPDSTVFAASETYFVTEECWNGIEKHFRLVLASALKRRDTLLPRMKSARQSKGAGLPSREKQKSRKRKSHQNKV